MAGEDHNQKIDYWHTCTNHDDICFTDGGSLLLATSSLTNRYWKGKISLYDNPTPAQDQGSTIKKQLHQPSSYTAYSENSITNVKYISKSNRAVTTHDSGEVSIWQLLAEGTSEIVEIVCEVAHDDAVLSLDVNSDQSRFATASSDCQLKIWSTDECSAQAVYTGHSELVSSTCFHPHSSDLLATCSYDRTLLLWDLRKLKPVISQYAFSDLIPTIVTYIPTNPNLLLIGSEAGEIVTMDIRNLKSKLARAKLHNSTINRMAFSSARPDLLVTCSDDLTVLVFKLQQDSSLKTEYKDASHSDFVRGVAWAPGPSCLLVSCSWDGCVLFHDAIAPSDVRKSGGGDM